MIRIIRKILSVLNRKERRQLGLLLLPDIFISIVDIAALAMLLFVINFYAQSGKSFKYAYLPDWLFAKDSLALVSCFLLLFLIKSIAGYRIIRNRYRFIFGVASRLSETNMLKYLEGAYMDYVNIDSAVHIRKISQEPVEFCHYVLAGAQQIVTEGMLIILSICGIIWFDARLFVLLFILLLPAVFILSLLTRKRIKAVRSNIMTSGEKALQYLQETLSGFVESNLYDKNQYFTRRYADYQQDLNNYLAELQITQGIPSRLIEVFAVFGLFILVVIDKVYPGSFQTTAFVTLGAFMTAAYKIIPGIVKISNISGQMRTYEFTMNNLGNDYQAKPNPVAGQPVGQPVTNIKSLTCRGVGFRYDNVKILNRLDLYIETGDFLGIQGNSGKGKTTFLNILLGFLAPEEGEIFFNDASGENEDRKRYWKHIAYVKQQPFLLHDTVLANITMNGADFDKERLQRAITLSGLEPFIGKSIDGMGIRIAENGKNISGGQRKRIAMARALYKKADLMILDEPFSELDEKSEERLLVHFKELARQGMCIILITHNRKSLSYCNKILSLDE